VPAQPSSAGGRWPGIRHHGPVVVPRAAVTKGQHPLGARLLFDAETGLRLVTSGGPLDGATWHCRDNLVVLTVQA
jgi:hypothetical protein